MTLTTVSATSPNPAMLPLLLLGHGAVGAVSSRGMITMTAAQMLERGQKLAADVDAALCGYDDGEALLGCLTRRLELLPLPTPKAALSQQEQSLQWLQGGMHGLGSHGAGRLNQLDASLGNLAGLLGGAQPAHKTYWQDLTGRK